MHVKFTNTIPTVPGYYLARFPSHSLVEGMWLVSVERDPYEDRELCYRIEPDGGQLAPETVEWSERITLVNDDDTVPEWFREAVRQ